MTIWQELQGAFDHYRPERHYMRGPGPKWRERHGGSKPSGALAGPIVNDEMAPRIVSRRPVLTCHWHAETGSPPTRGWETGVAGVDAALPHIEHPLWGGKSC